ncbi:MAG: HAMP domain-containing histidine kinase [Tannerellaceae bacterium]|jgi:signal transduction histidine kinase|nr:HAMP domain-containing histidine kinase [Tannerellaceae bacterium]
MKLSYKQRLFLYFSIIFAVFTGGVVAFEQSREKRFKTEALEEKLDAYAEIVNAALPGSDGNYQRLDSLIRVFPQNMRLSLIDLQGNVLFDNSITDLSTLENHALRPEIIRASESGTGTNIRTSSSNNREYLYYAGKFGNRYIRVALPYDIQTQRFLKPDNAFMYFIIALFVVMLLLMNVIADRFGKSIRQLRDFAVNADREFHFPDDELGEIGMKITENYRLLKESKKETDSEREKLLQHVHSSEEGLCFFSADRKVEFYNGLFIQYLNMLTDEPGSEPSVLFADDVFKGLYPFILGNRESYFETQIKKQGKTFSLRGNRFDDGSFEIILNDITKQEMTRQLKQEMTGNIAHELRTPVTSIRGYLETILEQPPGLEEEKKNHFITQAYNQTIALSELIRDTSLITKMEEAPQSFKTDTVHIAQILETLKSELAIPLQMKNIDMQWSIAQNVKIKGNTNLLYSIFRNLTDNTIHYAGENVKIRISIYNEDRNFYYFSFYDTGAGIPDENHLTRIFERFYRINEGRTRDTGGSGLGLSIVKNAIAFHKGTVTAKNRKGGGLEFLFTLHK